MKRKLTALLLSSAMLCAMGLPALAAGEGAPSDPAGQAETALPASVLYYGRVTEIMKDEQGTITRLVMDSEAGGVYAMNISADTVWIDCGAYAPSDPSDLEVGEGLYVFHSPVSTRSIPPQSAAFAVVRNIPQDMRSAMYHVVEAVTPGEDGGVTITTDNGGMLLHLDGETQLSAYAGGGAALEDISVGSRVMAWYAAVMLSYPGQAHPGHVMLLPETAQEGQQPAPLAQDVPAEGAQITMELDGKVPNMAGRYENGTAMVPVAAVAQALGLQTTYTPDTDQGVLVTVESDSYAVYLYLDQDLVYGATKIEGAVGMTGPQRYGKSPYIAAPGTTWAPAQLFQMLGKTVTLEGTNLVIK